MTDDLRYTDERPAPPAASPLLLWALCLVAAAGSAVLLADVPLGGGSGASPAALAGAPGVASSPAPAARTESPSPPARSPATAPASTDELHAEREGARGANRAH